MKSRRGFVGGVGVFLVIVAVMTTANAQEPRILVVGDSWAVPMRAFALTNALNEPGLGEYGVVGATTAIGGTLASQWATPGGLNLITQALEANPTIDIVHLSMGGNDVLRALPIVLVEVPALVAQIYDDIDTVVNHILSIRPDAKVALCSYDYISDASLNEILQVMAETAVVRSHMNPLYYYINNYGLMQYTYGYPGLFGPGEVPYPGGYPSYTPLMGGDFTLPSPPAALSDAIHLTYDGYDILALRCVDEFYAGWLTAPPPPDPASLPLSRPATVCLLVPVLLALGIKTLKTASAVGRRHGL